jgi:acylphosphatase
VKMAAFHKVECDTAQKPSRRQVPDREAVVDAATSDGHVSEHVAVCLLVRGLVQGVGFRAAARSMASALRLRGWVRNRPDGSVEIVAAGPVRDVQRLELWCHRGPSAARVDSVETSPVGAAEAGQLRGFRIAR